MLHQIHDRLRPPPGMDAYERLAAPGLAAGARWVWASLAATRSCGISSSSFDVVAVTQTTVRETRRCWDRASRSRLLAVLIDGSQPAPRA